MKRKLCFMSMAALMMPALFLSCSRLGFDSNKSSDTGRLCVAFADGCELFTKAYANLPDTSDFILQIRSSEGEVLYNGKYGDCPETLDVSPGSYIVRTLSSEFSRPDFDSPQFGDEQCVVVPARGSVSVRLLCRQINSGVRLRISQDFLTGCPDAVLFLKSDEGKLMYSYSEKRTAYFLPGPVSLVMNTENSDKILFVRELNEREILTLGVSVSSSEHDAAPGMSISVDTTRIWSEDSCVIGAGNEGYDSDDALSVSEAIGAAGKEDVWVSGYVVGGDLTSASASFNPPFKSRTSILLGPKSITKDKKSCVSVQLPDGDLRESLNLADNPDILGKRISVKGDIVSAYYGIPGIKNTTEFKIL